MGMLERYKKPGGFLQLLSLLESCGDQKREKFLSLIKQESPIWEETLIQKIINIEKIKTWPDSVLENIFSQTKPLTLAGLIKGSDAPFREKILSLLQFSQKRKAEDILAEKEFTKDEIHTIFEKFILEIRAMSHQGLLKFGEVDKSLEIPSKIEEELEKNDIRLLSVDNTPLETKPNPEKSEKSENSSVPFNLNTSAQNSAAQGVLISENQTLKTKLNQLLEENKKLKLEKQNLEERLNQIRRIA